MLKECLVLDVFNIFCCIYKSLVEAAMLTLVLFIVSACFHIRIPVTKLTVKLSLAAVCAYIGSLLAFPGLRLAQTHLDAVQMNSDRPLIQ